MLPTRGRLLVATIGLVVDVEEDEGPEVGFTRPVEGIPNVEYLSAADRAAAEEVLFQTLD